MGAVVTLARLDRVSSLRDAWPDEALNFTPWLAEEDNLGLLGEALGVSLELEAVEKQVGPFAADILAKDRASQNWVIIENQITPTDHTHLGQLLTYAAGFDAKIVVWIAESFREQHRAAIDFLNHATSTEYAFFGVQIELYKIGSSSLAPRFTVIAKPNDWNKQAQAAKQTVEGDLTEIQKLYREYWSQLIGLAPKRYPALASRSPFKANWQTFESLRGGNPSFTVNATFSADKGLRAEVYVDGSLAKAAFNTVLEHKEQVESTTGVLSWEYLPQGKASRIALYMPGVERPENRDRWPKQHEWLLTWAPKLASAIGPLALGLDAASLQQQVDNAAVDVAAE